MKKKNNTIEFEVTVPKKFNIFKKDWLEYQDENGQPKGVLKVQSINQIKNDDKNYNKFRCRCEIVQPKYSCKQFASKSGCCFIQGNRWEIYTATKEQKNKFFQKPIKHLLAEEALRRANQGVLGGRVG